MNHPAPPLTRPLPPSPPTHQPPLQLFFGLSAAELAKYDEVSKADLLKAYTMMELSRQFENACNQVRALICIMVSPPAPSRVAPQPGSNRLPPIPHKPMTPQAYMQGKIRGFMHLDNGQESIPAFVADTIKKARGILFVVSRDDHGTHQNDSTQPLNPALNTNRRTSSTRTTASTRTPSPRAWTPRPSWPSSSPRSVALLCSYVCPWVDRSACFGMDGRD